MSNRIISPNNLLPSPSALGSTQHHQPLGLYYAPTQSPLSHQQMQHCNYANLSLQQLSPESTQASLTQQSAQKYNYDPSAIPNSNVQFQPQDSMTPNGYAKESIKLNGLSDPLNPNYSATYNNYDMLQTPSPAKQPQYSSILEPAAPQSGQHVPSSHFALQSFSGSQSSSGLERKSSQYALSSLLKATPPFHNPTNPLPLSSEFNNTNYFTSGGRQPSSSNSALQQQQQQQVKPMNASNPQDTSMNVGSSSNLNQFLKAKGYSATATSTPINQYRDIQVSSFHNNLPSFEVTSIPTQSKTESFIEQEHGLKQQQQFLPAADLYRKQQQQIYSQSPPSAAELTSTAYLRNFPSPAATETYESKAITRPAVTLTSPNQSQFERSFKKAEILPLQQHNSATRDELQSGQLQQLQPPRAFLGKKTIQINLATTLNQVSSTPTLAISNNQNSYSNNNNNSQMIKRNNIPLNILPSNNNNNTNFATPGQTNTNNTIGCYSSYSSLPSLVSNNQNGANNPVHPLTAAQINGTNTSLNDFQTIPGFSTEISPESRLTPVKPTASMSPNVTNLMSNSNNNISTINPSMNTSNTQQHYRLINGTVPISSIQLSPNQFSLNHDNQSLSSRDHISSSPQQSLTTATPSKNTQKYSSLDHNAFQRVIKMISPQPISANSNLPTAPGSQQKINSSNPDSGESNNTNKSVPTFSQFQANQSAYKITLQPPASQSQQQSASKANYPSSNNTPPLTTNFSLKDLPLWKPPTCYQEDKIAPRAASLHPRNGSLGNQNSISVISPYKTQIRTDLQTREQQQQQQSSSSSVSKQSNLPSPPAQFTHNPMTAAQLHLQYQPVNSSANTQKQPLLQQQTYEIRKEFSFKKKSPSDHLSNATDLSIQPLNIPPPSGNNDGSLDDDDDPSSPSPDNSTHDTPRTDLSGIQKIPSLVVQPNFLPQHFKLAKDEEQQPANASYASQSQQSTSDVYKLYRSVMQQQQPPQQQQSQQQKPSNSSVSTNSINNALSLQSQSQQQPQLSLQSDQDKSMPSSTRAMQPPYMTAASPQKKPLPAESTPKGYQLTPPKQQQPQQQQQQSYLIPKSYSSNTGYNIVSSSQQYSITPLQSSISNIKNPQILSASAAAASKSAATAGATGTQRISFTPIVGPCKSPVLSNSNTIKNNLIGFPQNSPNETRQRSSQSATTADSSLKSELVGVTTVAPANRMKSPNTDYKQKIWENILIQRKIKQNSQHTSPSTSSGFRNEQPFYSNQANSSSEGSFNNLIKQSSPGQQQQEILPQKQQQSAAETITYRLQPFEDVFTASSAVSPILPSQQRNALNINGIQQSTSEKSTSGRAAHLQLNLEVPTSAVQNPYYSDSRAMTFSQMSGNSSSSPSGQNSPVFTTSQQKILDRPQGQQKDIPSIFSAAILTREDRVSSIQVQSTNQAAGNIDKALRMSFGGDSPNSTFV